MVERARELRTSDAFEPAESSVPAHATRRDRQFSRKRIRQTIVVFIVLCVIAVGLSLLLPYYGLNSNGMGGQIYPPDQVAQCWGLWFYTTFGPLFDPTLSNQVNAMVTEFSETHDVIYSLVIQRGAVTLVVIACGFLLAISGLLFQSSFRNPLATPSMLGVSDGVTLGCIVYAALGFSQATDNLGMYFACVYGFGAGAVVVVLLLSRVLSGSKTYNVFDMLLLGTVICQLLGGINSYITNFGMDTDTWDNYYDLTQAGSVLGEPSTWLVVLIITLVTAIPVYILRFKLNLISFSDAEGRMMGVRTGSLRIVALVIGSAMQLAALATIGQVAMLSLAVPFIVRYLMPSEFRYQLLGNFLLGVMVLLVAMAIQHFTIIGAVTVPIGTLVSILIIPFFVWAVALQRSSWGGE